MHQIIYSTPTPIRSLRGDVPEGLAAVVAAALTRAYQRVSQDNAG